MAMNNVEAAEVTVPSGGARLVDDEGRPVLPMDDDLPPAPTGCRHTRRAPLQALLRGIHRPTRA